MASDWFIRINNVEHGPLSSERLKQLAQEGKVTPETPIRKGASGSWALASAVKGLHFSSAISAAPPAVTPRTRPSDLLRSAPTSVGLPPTPEDSASAPQSVGAPSVMKSAEPSRPGLPTVSAGVFLLFRKQSATGSTFDVSVSVDGQPAGSLAEGDRLKVTLAPGSHTVKLAGGGLRRSSTIAIQASQISQYETYFSNWGILGGGLRLCATPTARMIPSERLDDIVEKMESLGTATQGQQGTLIGEVQRARKPRGAAKWHWWIIAGLLVVLLLLAIVTRHMGNPDPLLGKWQCSDSGWEACTAEFGENGSVRFRVKGNGTTIYEDGTYTWLDSRTIKIVSPQNETSSMTITDDHLLIWTSDSGHVSTWKRIAAGAAVPNWHSKAESSGVPPTLAPAPQFAKSEGATQPQSTNSPRHEGSAATDPARAAAPAKPPEKDTPADRFKLFAAKVETLARQGGKIDGIKPREGSSIAVTYDVRKTDSLVAPIVATLDLQWEEGSSGVDYHGGTYTFLYKAQCRYTFREDDWVFDNVTVSITNLDEVSEFVRGFGKLGKERIASSISEDPLLTFGKVPGPEKIPKAAQAVDASVSPQPRVEQTPEKLSKEITFDLGNGVKLEMVGIRAGVFLMGDESERPQHKVRITKPFYMGKYLVTQEQWEAVMDDNPSQSKGPKKPVVRVSWDDCQAFMAKLNANIAAGKGRFALPTEAQWEYACRAGSTTKYCFGDDESQLDEYAWYKGNSAHKTHPVGEKRPNAWGLYDMHGSAWEWCADWYDSNYYGASPADDPMGPASGSRRVYRGGGSGTPATRCRSAIRDGNESGYRVGNVGLRACLVPTDR